ncbi:MAG: DUF481 domain-containing protein [Planctomycetota bacterium]|jgi:putative salt-induced outer membrane protein YdiY|nr:DUF481 domain-containing protein [Planctomycetota bacterium]
MLSALTSLILASLIAQAPAASDSNEGSLSGSSDIGVTMINGNSQSANSAINFDLSYILEVHKFDFGMHYQGVRDTDRTTGLADTSSRLYRSDLQYNYFVSDDKKTYIWTNVATRQDEPTGLISRNNFGAGIGYFFQFENEIDFNLEGGATYVDEEKTTSDSQAAVTRLAFDFKWPVSEDLSILSSTEFLSGDNIETYVHDFSLRYSLSNDWYLQLTNNTAYDAFPSAGAVSTDSRFNITLGTSF